MHFGQGLSCLGQGRSGRWFAAATTRMGGRLGDNSSEADATVWRVAGGAAGAYGGGMASVAPLFGSPA
jgi:hypothetical protein